MLALGQCVSHGKLVFQSCHGVCTLCLVLVPENMPIPISPDTGSRAFPLDKSVVKYALPLTVAGWLIALFQNLLIAGIIPENIQPCTQGVSCTEEYIDLFGFLTIPMLSLLSFSMIIALLIILKRRSSK
jgi:hypothetical protein